MIKLITILFLFCSFNSFGQFVKRDGSIGYSARPGDTVWTVDAAPWNYVKLSSAATTTSYSINPASFFTNTIGLVWMGWGLTNSEISTLNTIIETYMDAVGRGYQ